MSPQLYVLSHSQEITLWRNKYKPKMVIIRDIFNDFSDEEDIELCCDDDDDLKIGSSELVSITYESRLDRFGQCKYFGDGCQRRIRASINGKRDMWEIRKINGTHTCVSTCISQYHTKLNSSFIANCIIQVVSEDPEIPIKALVKEVVTNFGYTMMYRKNWTAKQIVMLQIYGELEGSYKELFHWLNAVQCYAPDTIVIYATSRHEDDSSLILDSDFGLSRLALKGLDFSIQYFKWMENIVEYC
ncbi:hypothetical protein Lal_00033797 [Lupinus albus]|nr:hypothetical protein Lal_00033797 [Lupinus albus]